MRTINATRSPQPPADKVLLALTCMAERDMTVTATEAEIASQARIPESLILPALQDLERRGEIQQLLKKRDRVSWLVVLAFDPEATGETLSVPWSDPIEPPYAIVYPPMPPELPLPFYWPNRKVARSYLKIIAGLQSLATDGWCCATLAELCDASGMRDVNTVKFHLRRLESEGVIRVHHGREYGRARRAFELLRDVEVPREIWPGIAARDDRPAVDQEPIGEPVLSPRQESTRVIETIPAEQPQRRCGQLLFAWTSGIAD